MTWQEVAAVDKSNAVAILPVGAIEAHGPHLPLSTDVIIAQEMARRAGERLSREGWEVFLLPAACYTAAEFARNFPGTVNVERHTLQALITDVAECVRRAGVRWLCLANSHLDPANLRALHEVVEFYEGAKGFRVVFMDKTKRRWVERLTDEFKSGSCHAGQYETSLVLAARPDLVRPGYRSLQKVLVNLAEKIRAGARSFEEVGASQAYCGEPAAASAEEGHRSYDALAEMLVTAFLERVHEVER